MLVKRRQAATAVFAVYPIFKARELSFSVACSRLFYPVLGNPAVICVLMAASLNASLFLNYNIRDTEIWDRINEVCVLIRHLVVCTFVKF